MNRHKYRPLRAAWKPAMKPSVAVAWVLCACAAMFAPEPSSADPRDIAAPPEQLTPEMSEARREQTTRHMAEWLPRLVGRYRLEGMEFLLTNLPVPPSAPNTVRGKADCVLVGSGPGVQCVIHVEWERTTSWSSAWLDANSPTIILYGIDPMAGRIRYQQVNQPSIAQQGEAVLNGDTLFYQENPVNQRRIDPRQRRFQLTAPAADAPIKLSAEHYLAEGGRFWFVLRVDMILKRVAQDASD